MTSATLNLGGSMFEQAAERPVFKVREKGEKQQVRFWSAPDLYKRFQEEVKSQELVTQDVFNQFMCWFIESSRQGKIEKRTAIDCL